MAGADPARVKKKAVAEDRLFLYADEASVSVVSPLSHTYAPRSQTPVITTSTEISSRVYVASAISSQGHLSYQVRNKPFDSAAITVFLEHLLEDFENQKLLLVWDGASIHCSAETKSYLQAKENQGEGERLHLVMQPHYSPELNADEQVWSHIKNNKLKNSCNENRTVLNKRLETALDDLRKQPKIVRKFFHHPDLGYYR